MPTNRPDIARVIADESAALVALQRRLFDAGLMASAAAVNEATNALGWEGARLLEKERVRNTPNATRDST